MSTTKDKANKNGISTGYLFNYIANDWRLQLNVLLAKHELDHLQYSLLNALQIHHQSAVSATQVMLSSFTGVDKMTTSKIMRLMENKKLIKRKESKLDSRAKTVEISDKGKRVLDLTTQIIEKFEKEFFDKIHKVDKNINQKLSALLN